MSLQKKIVRGEIWAFIPARSGSKSVKDKNIFKLNNRPLIYYTFQTLKKIKRIKKIVFSTDSKKYIKIAKNFGKFETHLRKNYSSIDSATDLDVFNDFIEQNKNRTDFPEFFLHLRPTTPVRDPKIVKKALVYFIKNSKKFTSLRSVSHLINPPQRSVSIKSKKLFSLFYKSFNINRLNNARQSFEKSYLPNGYVDIIKTENIFKKSLHGNKVAGWITKDFNSDIDNKFDFMVVDLFMKNKKKLSKFFK